MSGALDPIQEDLPLDLPGGPHPTGTPSPQPLLPAWQQPAPPAGPSLAEQVWTRLRALPWAQWRKQATPVIRSGAQQLRGAVEQSANQAGSVARAAISRGAPYTLKLARATAGTGLVPGILLWAARIVHVLGLPAVVVRSAVQVLLVHRSGLAIEEVTFFRFDDPAAYTVYEAPGQLGLAAAIAFVPTLVNVVLAVICLAPALAPRMVLHLPVTWLTLVQIWLGLAFAAHALPIYEEAGPLAEQARVGVGRAQPGALVLVAPAYLVAWVTRFGGLLPALLSSLAIWWLAGAALKF
jgi:hypothetical protein